MKKIILVIGALLFIVGCSSSASTNLDISKASEALDAKYTNMNEMDSVELEAVYELDLSLFDEYKIKSSSLANGNFYALIKVSDSNKSAVKDKMDNMFKVLENQSNLYSPEAVNLLKNRLETSVGNYLIYIVSEDNNAYYDAIKGFIS